MKKIILSLMAVMATMSINAQVVKVYNTKSNSTDPVAVYANSDDATYKVVFDEKPAVASITLSATSAEIKLGETTTLTADVVPSYAKVTTVTWSSDNSAIASVDANGVVTGVAAGTATITATATDGSGVTATCSVTVIAPTTGKAAVSTSAGIPNNEVSWVQLWAGGPKWATFNVGATSESGYGNMYSWGSTTVVNYSNYTRPSNSDIQGTDLDTAKKIWGDNWQMPTKTDYENLIANTTKVYTTINSMGGWLLTGKDSYSSNSIFLPCAGYQFYGYSVTRDGDGCYYSSTPNADSRYPKNAWIIRVRNSSYASQPTYGVSFDYDGYDGCTGLSVRAILKE